MVKLEQLNQKTVITLSPNRSANWHQCKILLGVMSTIIMLIALAWSLVGAWLVLPFAGCEIGLLTFLMYRVNYASYQKQIITITADTLVFQTGTYYPQQQWVFKRLNTQLAITEEEVDTEFATTQLRLEGEKGVIEIGNFLNQSDRRLTLSYLQQQGLRIHSNKWWQLP